MWVAQSWRVDALMRMVGVLFLFVFAGSILFSLMPESPSPQPNEGLNFTRFIIGNMVFHVGTLVATWFFLREHGVGWVEAFGLSEGPIALNLVKGLLAGLMILPIALLLGVGSSLILTQLGMDPRPQDVVQILGDYTHPLQLIYFGIVAIIIAPIIEEVLFRGILYPAIRSYGFPNLALWGTSILFALTHQNLMSFIPLTVLAVLLIKLYERSGNLLTPIMAHAVFNASNFVLLLIENGTIRLD